MTTLFRYVPEGSPVGFSVTEDGLVFAYEPTGEIFGFTDRDVLRNLHTALGAMLATPEPTNLSNANVRLALYASWWKDDRLTEMELLRFDIQEMTLMMKYGSEWQDKIELGPFDVSEVSSLKLKLRQIAQ